MATDSPDLNTKNKADEYKVDPNEVQIRNSSTAVS